ncbi:MAG: DUF427 domain-containing protein [Longimicrobiales bacterium]|nr:DUF427 domain-containing protein [Longimicrobiales bacterium]
MERPPFAEAPGPEQESVWDYPRPPAMVPDARRVRVRLGDAVLADTTRAVRILETASPPVFYLPPEDVATAYLHRAPGVSRCEWKGPASYWTVRASDSEVVEGGAWSYEDPLPDYREIAGYLSFYPARFRCSVDGERVRSQGGGFYGGWVTDEIVGPWKGDPGTGIW